MKREQFIEEVTRMALHIAKHVRNEDHLQSISVLSAKFQAECLELAEARYAWDEIPDIMYYAACLQAQGELYAWVVAQKALAELAISEEQAQVACLAKYQRRAAGMPKDIEAERIAIMEAVHSCPA